MQKKKSEKSKGRESRDVHELILVSGGMKMEVATGFRPNYYREKPWSVWECVTFLGT
jgi:hypothetical protein